MTISFEARTVDIWHCLCYLAVKTVTSRCLLIFILITPFLLPLADLYRAKPGFNAEYFIATSFVPVVVETYTGILFFSLLGLILGPWITPLITITIDPQFYHRREFGEIKSSWRSFSAVVEETNHLYFMGFGNVCAIPKSAFESRADAQLFFETALTYWRNAKGIPAPLVPEVIGVWPPAPTIADSAEPGDAL